MLFFLGLYVAELVIYSFDETAVKNLEFSVIDLLIISKIQIEIFIYLLLISIVYSNFCDFNKLQQAITYFSHLFHVVKLLTLILWGIVVLATFIYFIKDKDYEDYYCFFIFTIYGYFSIPWLTLLSLIPQIVKKFAKKKMHRENNH